MLALGKLLELTLAGHEPASKIQLTPQGTRLRWLAEGALEITPACGRDNGMDLLLSAGIHGNETAPIELLDRLLHRIARSPMRGYCCCSATRRPCAVGSVSSSRTSTACSAAVMS